jgi:hypothetical protein
MALVMYDKALHIYRKSVGEEHRSTADIHNKIGEILWMQGQLEKSWTFLPRHLPFISRMARRKMSV